MVDTITMHKDFATRRASGPRRVDFHTKVLTGCRLCIPFSGPDHYTVLSFVTHSRTLSRLAQV